MRAMGLTDLPDWLTARIREDPTGCWVWVGSRYANGYGRVWDKRTGKKRGAHRVVHEVVHGVTLTRAQIVDHTCGHIVCVRHTEVVSNAENIRRAFTRPSMQSVRQQQATLRGQPVVTTGPPKYATDPDDPLAQLNVHVPRSLVDQVHALASQRGVSMRQVGREAFSAWVAAAPNVLAPPVVDSAHAHGPATLTCPPDPEGHPQAGERPAAH